MGQPTRVKPKPRRAGARTTRSGVDRRRRASDSRGQAVERRRLPRAPLLYSEIFPSSTEQVEPVMQRTLAKLGELGCLNGSHAEIDLALREALINAVKHGNRGSRRKRVELRCFQLHDGGVLLVVRDEGAGFDPSEIPDPTRPENLLRDSGRGILLMRSFMDEVRFERGGREIRLKKKT